MRTIYKYQIEQCRTIAVPVGSKVLKVGLDHENLISIWIELETNNLKLKRTFQIFATGSRIPDGVRFEHIGTVITPDKFVWHIYELYEDMPKQ